MERLEVEDDEQRQRRIQIQLEKLNNSLSSSGAPQARQRLNFDFGNRATWDVKPPTELLSRVQAFLPQIEASNAILAQQVESNPESVDIENIDENKNQYIEMNLGLGVFEDQKKRVRKQGKDKAHHRRHQTATKLSSASASETSSSEHDATHDPDSSDPDTDSSSEIITSFELAPRSIKPLPKRTLASRVKPKIQVLNEGKE